MPSITARSVGNRLGQGPYRGRVDGPGDARDRLHVLPPLGQDGAPDLVLLHGFTQTGASWDPLVSDLAEGHRVHRVDLPGHGGSAETRLDLAGTAAALAEQTGRATYVGYSLGGRVALRLALGHPEVVERLVLVGATAGIDDPAERTARRAHDEELARSVEQDGVDAFLDRWLAQPLFATLPPERAGREARRANTAAGLAASLRLSGAGTMDPPWWDELPALAAAGIPVSVVAGEQDLKFRALGERLATGIGPTARLVLVPGAGHACHLEQPEAFLAASALTPSPRGIPTRGHLATDTEDG